MARPVERLTTVGALEAFLKGKNRRAFVLLSSREGDEACQQMEDVFVSLADDNTDKAAFAICDVSTFPANARTVLKANAVPQLWYFIEGTLRHSVVNGADAQAYYQTVQKGIVQAPDGNGEDIQTLLSNLSEALDEYIRRLIGRQRVMVFIKGTKTQPHCKFAKELVALFNSRGVDYDYFNIFDDDRVRERMKVLFNWPTFPQIFVDGSLVGGLDIVKQMTKEEFIETFIQQQ